MGLPEPPRHFSASVQGIRGGWPGLGSSLKPFLYSCSMISWSRPAAPRHAHPHWMGDGLVPKQMKNTPSSPWLTSSPRATPSFISACQQGSQAPAALLKLLQSCQSPPPGREFPRVTATNGLPSADRRPSDPPVGRSGLAQRASLSDRREHLVACDRTEFGDHSTNSPGSL